MFVTYKASKSLKLSFALNCVLKRAKRFQLTRFAFDLHQKFESKAFLMNRNRFRTRQTHDRDVEDIIRWQFYVRVARTISHE